MALAFDATSESTSNTADFNWTHTPVGTPKGVVVFVFEEGINDTINGVTYGGVAMTQVNSAQDSAGEPGRCFAYFLGSSIPTGAKTVAVDQTGSTDSKYGAAVTVTAATNTQLAGTGSAKVEGDTANPSVTITGISGASYGFGGLWSGQDAEASVTAGSGMTKRNSLDFGARTATIESSTNPNASGDLTIAFTVASEDVAMVGIAIEEIAATRKLLGLLGVG